MPIPDRFKLSPVSDEIVGEMCELCDLIEREVEQRGDPLPLLEKWHLRATRACEPSEFTSYWKAIDKEDFVREALSPRPISVENLCYAEVAAVLESVVKAELSESESAYYLNWLNAQFPNCDMSDLIDWPDEWFGNASLFRDASGAFRTESNLSNDQILGYAMARSKRLLPGSPSGILMPYPIPP